MVEASEIRNRISSVESQTLTEITGGLTSLDMSGFAMPEREVEAPPTIRKRKIGKYLYLPVSHFEPLEAPIALAKEMAAHGFQVLIAPMRTIAKGQYGFLPPGIVLFRSLTLEDAKSMFTAEQTSGHLVAVSPKPWLAPENKWALHLTDLRIEPLENALNTNELVSLWRRNQYEMPFRLKDAFVADICDDPVPPLPANHNEPLEKIGGSGWILAAA